MEPITHALSGAVIGYALPGKRRWWLPAWAALVAASPDMDVFFTRTPLQYIEYHRGITHSFVGGLGLALLLALIPWLMNRWRVPKSPTTLRHSAGRCRWHGSRPTCSFCITFFWTA